MLSGSDTESEDDDDFLAGECHSYSLTPAPGPVCDLVKTIEVLEAVDISLIAKDASMHSTISGAAQEIVSHLDLLKAGQGDSLGDAQFALIVQPTFMETLFLMRKVFHAIAATEVQSGNSVVVCWVDVVLVKIADVAVTLASGAGQLEENLSEKWRHHREDDNLRGASQLPGLWTSIGTVITSAHSSPAAKRIAIRIMFAVCVLLPHITHILHDEVKTLRCDLSEALRRCVLNTVTGGFRADYSSDPMVEQERINFAIIISLYAAVDSERNRQGFQFRETPHTLSCLLDLLHVVMYPDDVVTTPIIATPLTNLDAAQRIIVEKFETMYWLWHTWDDPRLANTEIIALTTATWLFYASEHNRDFNYEITEGFQDRLRLCGNAILNVLFHSLSFLKTHPPNVVENTALLQKAGDIILSLLQEDSLAEQCHVCSRQDICKVLYEIYVYAGDSKEELNVKETFVQVLVLFNAPVLATSMDNLLRDSSLDFLTRVDAIVGRCGLASPQMTLKTSLDFLVLLRTSNFESLGPATRAASLALVRSILQRLSEFSSGVKSQLTATLLVTLSQDQSSRLKVAEQERLWDIVIRTGPSDPYICAAFAQHILALNVLGVAKSSIAGAWDCLRDFVLLTLRYRFIGEEEPLSILVCPLVCHALMHLLRRGPLCAHFILNSPWTTTLCLELQMLLDSDTKSLHACAQILQTRLSLIARQLIGEIAGSNPGGTEREPKPETRLISCMRPNIGSQLLFVPLGTP